MTTVIEELAIGLGYQVDSAGLDKAETAGVDAAKRVESRWGEASKKIRSGINAAGKAIGLAMGAAAGATIAFTKEILDQGKDLDTWRKKLGSSAEDLGRVEQGFRSLNIEQDNTREALKTLRENLGELERLGTGPARDSLGSLGLTLKDLQGLTLEDQLGVLSDALQGVENHSQRLSIAIELMGEDGAALLPALELGSRGIRELGDAASDSGRVMSDDLVDSTVRVNKSMDRLKGELSGVALELAESLIPELEDGTDAVIQFTEEHQKLIKEDIPSAIRAIGEAFAFVAEQTVDAIAGVRDFADELSDADLRSRVQSGRGLGERIFDAATSFGGSEVQLATERAILGHGVGGTDDPAALGIVGERSARALTPAGRRQLRAERAAIQQGVRGAQDVAAIAEADQANREAFAAANATMQRGRRGRRFNAGERAGASGGGSAAGGEDERAAEEAAKRSEELFGEMFRSLAEQSGAGAIAVQASLEAAAKQLQEGAVSGVAQEAGLRRLGSLTGKDYKQQKSGLLDEFGVQAVLPGVTRSGPQVQVTETTNNYTFDQKFNVPPGDVREVARHVAAATRESWRAEVEGTIRATEVKYAR